MNTTVTQIKRRLLIALTIIIYTVIASTALWVSNSFAKTNPYITQTMDKYSFTQPITHLSKDELINFAAGRSLFKKLWIAAPATTKSSDGLGPLYNARSCFQCHTNAGRGQIPESNKRAVSIIMRLSIPTINDEGKSKKNTSKENVTAEPNYGTQLQNFAVTGLAGEGELKLSYSNVTVKFADGEVALLKKPKYQLNKLRYGELHPKTMMSPRIAPQLVGMGLLDKIDKQEILKYSDLNDTNNDGISGKPNQVWSKQHKKVMLGRFGYKAGIATLDEQNQSALTTDLGISTPLFTHAWGDCTQTQTECLTAPHGNNASQSHLEASQAVTDTILFYTQNLAIPEQRQAKNDSVISGKNIFTQLGCAACHRPSYTVKKQTIYPYTDMLLHDMGDELADNRPEAQATGKEWRTAPLWGIGLTEKVNGHSYYMHDGRARSLQEAILWHGGEAQRAQKAYINLPKDDRQKLLSFLKSL